MELVDNVLKKVTDEDIIDGTFIIPDGITIIEQKAFKDCESLVSIIIPASIKSIGQSAFWGCKSLLNITIPDGVEKIEKDTFRNCESLINVYLPETVTEIGIEAFSDCTSLKNINLPKNITKIGDRAFCCCESLESIVIPSKVSIIERQTFLRCYSLENIVFPEGLLKIQSGAFSECKKIQKIKLPENINVAESAFSHCCSLSTISLPNNIERVGANAFVCTNIKEIITPWGTCQISNLNQETAGVITYYLFKYSNHILKDKYEDIEEFLTNTNIAETMVDEEAIYKKDAITKFKNLFKKTRKNYNFSSAIFKNFSLEQTDKLNYKIWNQIDELMSNNLILKRNLEMSEVFTELIAIFGLFEKDDKQKLRLLKFQEIFLNKDILLDVNTFLQLKQNPNFVKQMDIVFEEVNAPYFSIKETTNIPEEFIIYLKPKLSENELKKIKKISGHYGKRINDYLKENYSKIIETEYKLKKEFYKDEDIQNILFEFNNISQINYSYIYKTVYGCKKVFDEDFYNFVVNNSDFIFNNEEFQLDLQNIQMDFNELKQYYGFVSGIDKITLKQVVDYLESVPFDYHEGNYELAQEVLKAGVKSQKAFDYYEHLYEKNNTRHLSSLIKRSNIYEIDNYIIKAELLRKDDIFAMLVGESNYTDSCQAYDGPGQNCLAHAVSSDDGGIFVTRLLVDGEWILLTESWDWQNNNVYCHDSIEITPYLENGDKNLKDAVAKVLKLDAKLIIESSKEEVEKYIEARKRIIEKSLSINKEQELEKLLELKEREVISLVTIGFANDKFGLFDYFKETISVAALEIKSIIESSGEVIVIKPQSEYKLSHFQPVDYDYTQAYFDSRKSAFSDSNVMQYVIAGSIENLYIRSLEPLVPIYRDERRIFLEKNVEIRDCTTKKVKDIYRKAYTKEIDRIDVQKFHDSNIYLGEDWYLVYKENENNSIYISDLAKKVPNIRDENSIQHQEILKTIYNLAKKYDQIEVDLKEDITYLLFLINKKLGYLEQIGEDFSYLASNPNQTRIISETEQDFILKSSKEIKEKKNQVSVIHNIKFKRGRLLEGENKVYCKTYKPQ